MNGKVKIKADIQGQNVQTMSFLTILMLLPDPLCQQSFRPNFLATAHQLKEEGFKVSFERLRFKQQIVFLIKNPTSTFVVYTCIRLNVNIVYAMLYTC